MYKTRNEFDYDNYTRRVLDWRVIDGDTVQVWLDMGYEICHCPTIRLLGINAVEMNEEAGQRSKDYLVELLSSARTDPGPPVSIWCRSVKVQDKQKKTKARKEKYGRYLAMLFIGRIYPVNCVNLQMVDSGYAVRYGQDLDRELQKCFTGATRGRLKPDRYGREFG